MSSCPTRCVRYAFPVVLLAALVLALTLSACASSGPRPGTGDVSFRLLWDGPADLDLHVEDPDGHHIGVFLPFSLLDPSEQAQVQAAQRAAGEVDPASSGILDIDCNASPDQLCPRPIENVYWPAGTAPRGTYRVRVVLFQELHREEEIPFVLEIRQGRDVVRSVPGSVSDARRISPWVTFEHSR